MTKHDDPTDWKEASQRCLTTALNRAEELAREATEFKSLESLIKTVSDVVGFAKMGARSGHSAGGGSDDE